MARLHNTNRNGGAWTQAEKKAVWQKGTVIENYSPDVWRRDKCGRYMQFSEHGNRQAESGWEIDHINPVANNGTDDLSNLQPLNWLNNSKKGDSLNWNCGS